MKDVIELAKQAGIRWDTDIDRSEWLVRRSELENLVALVRNAALEEAAQKCRNNHQRFKSYTGTLRAHDEDIAAAVESLKEPKP